MPTGYTAAIKDGITFHQFVWNCARGMGALIMMRDLPNDAPIPERFEPSDYHANKLKEAQENLAWLEQMSESEAERECLKEFTAAVTARRERIESANDLRLKYGAMLREVEAWAPPTCDHTAFKGFMREQIIGSMDHDCDTSYDKEPELYSARGWIDIEIFKARRDIEYHTAEHQKEIERTESRNSWLKSLRESLPAADAA